MKDYIGKGKELMESYSNLAYSIVGIVALITPLKYIYEYKLLYCMGAQALSVGSFIYHYYKRKPIYLFDWWAMTFFISITTGILLDNEIAWFVIVLWNIVYPYFVMGKTNNVFLEVGLTMTPALITVFLVKTLPSSIIITLVLLVALYIRSKDPDPKQAKVHDSWQHSLWHVLTAGGFLLIMVLP